MVLNRTSLDHYSFAEGAERVVIAPIVSKSITYSIVAHYIVPLLAYYCEVTVLGLRSVVTMFC